MCRPENVVVNVCVQIPVGDQKKMQDALDLELQEVI